MEMMNFNFVFFLLWLLLVIIFLAFIPEKKIKAIGDFLSKVMSSFSISKTLKK